MLGSGGGDDDVPCTCTHVGCYARCWVGVGGMITFLALARIGKMNFLKPSAAAVETCKYIQVQLMGSGAS